MVQEPDRCALATSGQSLLAIEMCEISDLQMGLCTSVHNLTALREIFSMEWCPSRRLGSLRLTLADHVMIPGE